jgi:hypothetical protein
MGRHSANAVWHTTAQSNWGGLTHQTFVTNTNIEIRAHCRWTTDADPSHLLDSPNLSALVTKSLINTVPDAFALWQAVPWSWLIDWGASVGSYLAATRNHPSSA